MRKRRETARVPVGEGQSDLRPACALRNGACACGGGAVGRDILVLHVYLWGENVPKCLALFYVRQVLIGGCVCDSWRGGTGASWGI